MSEQQCVQCTWDGVKLAKMCKHHQEIDELRRRLAEAQTDLRSTVADLKATHGGKAIAETAAFFLLEVVKHTDPIRYAEALRKWPFLNEEKGVE